MCFFGAVSWSNVPRETCVGGGRFARARAGPGRGEIRARKTRKQPLRGSCCGTDFFSDRGGEGRWRGRGRERIVNCARRVFPFLQLGVNMYERIACVGRSVGFVLVCVCFVTEGGASLEAGSRFFQCARAGVS